MMSAPYTCPYHCLGYWLTAWERDEHVAEKHPAAFIIEDYTVAPIDNVAPVFVRQMMLQAMAAEYAKATGESLIDMLDAARATWDTEWETDPAPRTFEAAIAAALSDLEHWDETS